MKTTILYAHPYEKSFNHAILSRVIQTLEKQGVDYQVIDLYKDGFNPVYSASELALYAKGKTLDPLIQQYQDQLLETNRLVLIFPIWWNGAPAILKGFFDKVLLKEFAYSKSKSGMLQGKLRQIQEAYVFTTSESPTLHLKTLAGNPVRKMNQMILKAIGIKRIHSQHLGRIKQVSPEKCQAFLDKIRLGK